MIKKIAIKNNEIIELKSEKKMKLRKKGQSLIRRKKDGYVKDLSDFEIGAHYNDVRQTETFNYYLIKLRTTFSASRRN